MIRSQIKKSIITAIKKDFGIISPADFSLGMTENSEYGDYSTNAALVLAKTIKKNPMEIARRVIENLVGFKKIEVASPGFINLWLSDQMLYKELTEILKAKNLYGKPEIKGLGSKINLEFISANPTGPLTIGNGRGAFLGDALARILQFAGYKVTREYYINDAISSTQIQELGKTILGQGEAYRGLYTDEIKKRLKEKYFSLEKMDEGQAGYLAAREIQRDNRGFIEKILRIKFDVWYSEEQLYKKKQIKKVVNRLNQEGHLYEKEGALWFRSTQFGDSEDRVALRSGGAPTYFLPDVAYHAEKLTQKKFDKVIDILGADHHGTFPRVLAGLKALGIDSNRVEVIFTQIVRLIRKGKEIKMSKRRGEFVTLEELIKETGLDGARYFFLEKSPATHMDFDLDLAKERSVKNPVYYIQYAHVRIASIFRFAKNRPSRASNFQLPAYGLLREGEEIDLIKKLIHFPEIIEDTARDYRVHRLTRYAYELARVFHNFYEKCRIITENKELTAVRLALAEATKIVLHNTLDLLDISAPEKM